MVLLPEGGRLLRRGKVKDIYELGEDKLLFEFTDRISAFDVVLPSTIPDKGEVLCRFSEFWFRSLDCPNHMLGTLHGNKMIVRRLETIPVEVVARGYIYGSLYERMLRGEVSLGVKPELAAKLPQPILDPTTKSADKDVPIGRERILANGWLTREELSWVEEKSIQLYEEMSRRCERAGFIMADVKFEFGRYEGEILLADSLGPDEFRLWQKDRYEVGRAQESYDKQLVRDWLIETGYRGRLDEAVRMGLKIPEPPELPKWLIDRTRERYITAFERITGLKFR